MTTLKKKYKNIFRNEGPAFSETELWLRKPSVNINLSKNIQILSDLQANILKTPL